MKLSIHNEEYVMTMRNEVIELQKNQFLLPFTRPKKFFEKGLKVGVFGPFHLVTLNLIINS